MKRKIDFVIHSKDDERLIFRFYPRSSHVHGFHDDPPKTWEEVYKVYYSFAILRQWRWDTSKEWQSEVMYSEGFDECSCISSVSFIMNQIICKQSKKRSFYAFPAGDGTNYTIKQIRGKDWEFILFQSYTNKGYRFVLNEQKMAEFAKVIDYFDEYMLQHGEGI